MASRGEYGAEKRQKELERKKKQEEKLECQRLKEQGDPQVQLERGAEESLRRGIEDAAAGGETNDEDKR